MLIIKLIVLTICILISGFKLSQYGQVLSRRTFFSEALFGIIFLSVITSLPEVFTSISSVIFINAPDMAASDAFGSILINLMIIAVLDFIQGKGGILSISNKSHILTVSTTIILMGLIILSMLFRSIANIQLGFLHIGYDSVFLILVYVFCVKLVCDHGQEPDKVPNTDKSSTSKLWLKFSFFAVVVIISGYFLAELGKEIVDTYNLSQTFVGLAFLAVVTSLPELIVSISALRLGSLDMAIGNVLGSNLFDTAIIPLSDIFYQKGQILSSLSISHIFTLSLCIVLSAIIITGLTYRSKKSFLKLGLDIIGMIIIFIIAVFFFYAIR